MVQRYIRHFRLRIFSLVYSSSTLTRGGTGWERGWSLHPGSYGSGHGLGHPSAQRSGREGLPVGRAPRRASTAVLHGRQWEAYSRFC